MPDRSDCGATPEGDREAARRRIEATVLRGSALVSDVANETLGWMHRMDAGKPRLLGLNHVALEVGDVDEALRFYGSVFAFQLRGANTDAQGRTTMAFIDMGDQFLAISGGRRQPADTGRHVGLVVDDRSAVMTAALAAGATATGRDFNFFDPWGNHVEIVAYPDVQFSKTDAVLRAMGVSIEKTPAAKEELRNKGIGDDGGDA